MQLAQRFAIDWTQLGPDGRAFHDNARSNSPPGHTPLEFSDGHHHGDHNARTLRCTGELTSVVARIAGMTVRATLGYVLTGVLCSFTACSKTPIATGELRVRPVRTIQHSAQVWSVAFSPDGALVASASVDKTVKLTRVADGVVIAVLQHPEGVTWAAFSPEGNTLATTSYDRIVRLWRVSDGTLLQALHGHSGTPWSVAFSPDGQRLASAGEDKSIVIWNVRDGSRERVLTGHALNIWSVAFSPTGKWIASGSFDHTAKLWDAESGTLVRTFVGHSQAIVRIAFSPDGSVLATGGDDSRVSLWQVSSGALIRSLDTSPRHVDAVAFSPDGKYLASGGHDKGLLGELVQNILGEKHAGGRGESTRIWRVSDGALLQTLAAHDNDVLSLAFSPDGDYLASASEDHTAIVWRIER
ncbi:MAG TPA: WD40 repeat domain-containing protein [Terriglobales bacterium]